MNELLETVLIEWFGASDWYLSAIAIFLTAGIMLLAGGIIFLGLRYIGMPIAKRILIFFSPSHAKRLNTELSHLLSLFAHIGPAMFWLVTTEWFFAESNDFLLFLHRLELIYLYIVVGLAVASFVNLLGRGYEFTRVSKEVPIDGLIQVVKLGLFFIITILVISELIDRSPVYLFSSLGALTALLLIVFRDTILGLVAGIQIAANRLVANGDWIEMPKYGADGQVLEVGLNLVKVKNWDHTITSIPTYALISESFKNWRAMEKSQGRRIKRQLRLQIESICYVPLNELQTLKETKVGALQYLVTWVENTNLSKQHRTNLGYYRDYCEFYLSQKNVVNDKLTFMLRVLDATEFGVGIEIYCFTYEKEWKRYEHIQAEIIEHFLAVMPWFHLKPYQFNQSAMPKA